MKLPNVIREYFTFNRNERIGLYVLISLILLLWVANQIIFLFEKPGVVDQQEFYELIESYEKFQPVDRVIEKNFFVFNPNTIDSTALDSLCLPFQIKFNLLRYRAKGGKVKYREDFKKLYGMNDSIFNLIEKYIDLESKPVLSKNRKYNRQVDTIIKAEPAKYIEKKKPIDRIEINSATESELKSLRGIGDILSLRIIKYRNLLGGFYNIEQVEEVYGLSKETFNLISPFLKIDSTLINKLDVNFASKNELVKHPYLDWKHVNAIFKYRSKIGFIEFISQLKDADILNDSIYQQVCPYLRTKID